MIYSEHIPELDMFYLRYAGSLGQKELLQELDRIDRHESVSPGAVPLLLHDFRHADLSRINANSMQTFISQRAKLVNSTGGPCILLVGNLMSFGMMRMYGALGEIAGVRNEGDTLVTTSPREVLERIVVHTARMDEIDELLLGAANRSARALGIRLDTEFAAKLIGNP